MKQLRKYNNFNGLIHGGGRDSSKSSVNHLWVAYPSENEKGFRNFFVSQYVAREMLSLGGRAVIEIAYSFALRLQNPAFLGWVVEIDFIQCLRNCIRTNAQARLWTFTAEGMADEKKWDVPGIVDFEMDTFGFMKEYILKQFWLRPMTWNQGGYDLACLLNIDDRYILRFVQITAAHEHSLKLKYFRDLAFKINETIHEIKVKHVEIVMLVLDEEAASKFSIPRSKVANTGVLTPWFCGDSMGN
jgi:hypothetical protein